MSDDRHFWTQEEIDTARLRGMKMKIASDVEQARHVGNLEAENAALVARVRALEWERSTETMGLIQRVLELEEDAVGLKVAIKELDAEVEDWEQCKAECPV